MKSSKWNLITALWDLAASSCFVFAAALQAERLPRVLLGISAICLLIGGIGFFCTYAENRKTND